MNKSNPIVLKPQSDIGMLSAENDDSYLFDCFLRNQSYKELVDIKSPKMILSGRTGTGKSAITRYLSDKCDNTVEIDLQNLSLDYIANSDVLRFLISMEIDTDLIFQALWKHVLCIELIRLIFDVKNESQSQSIFNRLWDKFSDDGRKAKALNYLRLWENKFWVDMDENVRELTEQLEGRLSSEFGAEIKKFKANAGYSRSMKREKKVQLQARIKKIANAEQLVDLSRVLDLIKEESERSHSEFYILFDRLDEKWTDESLKYKLVSALIESLKSFRKIKRLKIVVAIRTDLLEKTLQDHKSIGFQADKFGDILQTINWNREQLFELVSLRIRKLFERKYTKQNVEFYDIFCANVGQVETFDYLLNRTLMRPREILDFVNRCIKSAEGKGEISATIVRQAEVQYSTVRLESVEHEWRTFYPTLPIVLDNLKGLKRNLSFSDFLQSEHIDGMIETIFDSEFEQVSPVQISVQHYIADSNNDEKSLVAKHIIEMLHRIGVMGVKRQTNLTMQWPDAELSLLTASDLGNEFRIQIHEAFDIALNTK